MKSCHCSTAHGSAIFAQVSRVMQWLVPGAIIVFIPKCPACVAAYIAMFSGVAISFSAATYVRYGLLSLCIGALVFLVTYRGRKFITRKKSGTVKISSIKK